MEVLEGLLGAVEPTLRATEQARDGVAAALRCGGGAGRQRAAFAEGGIPALLGLLQTATLAA